MTGSYHGKRQESGQIRRGDRTVEILCNETSDFFFLDSMTGNRDPVMEKKNWRQICMDRTIASTLLVPDRGYPDILSTAFIAIGPPRNTVFLPVPMGVTEFPEELANGDMGLLAFSIREKYGLDHNRLPQYSTLEKELADEFFSVRDQARILLRQDRPREAQKLLTQLFRKQFIRVRTFLKQELGSSIGK